ncbi:MAG TPA: hypothetical protein QF353_05105 [Gammaproteobacteria bacterium]|nr:hypothetical protein [Gammaproteobacteria bacterium]
MNTRTQEQTLVISPSKTIKPSLKPSLPANKSEQLRALLFALMAQGSSTIQHVSHTQDVATFLSFCDNCKIRYSWSTPSTLTIEGTCGLIPTAKEIINIGNSGILLRFLTPLMALNSRPTSFMGDESMACLRPMNQQIEALSQLGSQTHYHQQPGHTPFSIQGPLTQGHCHLRATDSQYLSGLIYAACFRNTTTTFTLSNLCEHSYVQLTLDWLTKLGIHYTLHPWSSLTIHGRPPIHGFNHSLPYDLGSALFLMTYTLLHQQALKLPNVLPHPEENVLQHLQRMGAQLNIQPQSLCLLPSPPLQGIRANLNNDIDSLTSLAVLATQASSPSFFTGIKSAEYKECNRPEKLVEELTKMQAKITYTNNTLTIYPSQLRGANLNGHKDHRMVMALFLAASIAEGSSTINNTSWVNKSYPNFFTDIKKLGGIWWPLSS